MANKYTRDAIEFKLKEAEFFLEKIFEDQGSKDTPYYFSAFLAAARVVTTMLFRTNQIWAENAAQDIPDIVRLKDYRNRVVKDAWRDYKVSPAYYLNPHSRFLQDMTIPKESFLLKRQLLLVKDIKDPDIEISILDHSEALFGAAERLYYQAIEDGII